MLWLPLTCLNLGRCHIEPAVPDPRDTVHCCPAVWSLLRAGMPVHSSGGDHFSVTLWTDTYGHHHNRLFTYK